MCKNNYLNTCPVNVNLFWNCVISSHYTYITCNKVYYDTVQHSTGHYVTVTLKSNTQT